MSEHDDRKKLNTVGGTPSDGDFSEKDSSSPLDDLPLFASGKGSVDNEETGNEDDRSWSSEPLIPGLDTKGEEVSQAEYDSDFVLQDSPSPHETVLEPPFGNEESEPEPPDFPEDDDQPDNGDDGDDGGNGDDNGFDDFEDDEADAPAGSAVTIRLTQVILAVLGLLVAASVVVGAVLFFEEDEQTVHAPVQQEFEVYDSSTIEYAVKQVDLALLRALRDMDTKRGTADANVLEVERRNGNGHTWFFQTIEMSLNGGRPQFPGVLADKLHTAGVNATVTATGPDTLTIFINGLPTHNLILKSDHATAPPLPQGSGYMVVVIDDLGENTAVAKGLAELDYPVTFAIWPRASHKAKAVALAKQAGLDIIVHQPMEPSSYPTNDPGPGAVFTSMNAQEVLDIVNENLKLVPDAIGMNNHMGSKFTQDEAGMRAVLGDLQSRHLFFLDSVTSGRTVGPKVAQEVGIPFYRRNIFIDNVHDVDAIVHQLKKAERLALKTGRAIAIGHPHSQTLEALRKWGAGRSENLHLIRLSELTPEKPADK